MRYIDYHATALEASRRFGDGDYVDDPQRQILDIHISNFLDVANGTMVDHGEGDPFMRESEAFFRRYNCLVYANTKPKVRRAPPDYPVKPDKPVQDRPPARSAEMEAVDAYIFEHTGRKPEDFYRFSSSTRRDLRKQARAAMNGGPPMKVPGASRDGHD